MSADSEKPLNSGPKQKSSRPASEREDQIV
jgi:hypothetical protein